MGLNPRQKRFVEEYLRLGNGKEAAVAAGYSAKGAEQQASRLLSLPEVQAYRRELEQKLFDELGISKAWIGRRLVEIVERASRPVPHLSWNSATRQKEPDGLWVSDDTTAIKALHELYVQLGFAQGGEETGEQRQSFEDWLAEQNGGSRL
jgi:phage terminase small subunit